MISFGFRRGRRNQSIASFYGAIVAQARTPTFYRDLGVPDTVFGRIDMIILHLGLVLRRLRQDSQSGQAIGQQLFDRFCRDMDDNFREMGVGDLKVPKEMQRVAEAFYGRAKVYDAALDAEDIDALATAVTRNIFAAVELPLGARPLATYVLNCSRQLAQTPIAALERGEIDFPAPVLDVARPSQGSK